MSDWVSTTCMRCAVGCGQMQLGVDEGYGIEAARGDGDHPVSNGLACHRGIEESANPQGEWLSAPLVRKGGTLVETSWEEALDRVADRFGSLIEQDRDAIAVLGSGQQTNEAAYALGKLARGGIGTRNYDANTTLCMASAVTAYYQAFGSDAPPCTYDDIPDAETHIVWGANPAVAHPVLFQWIQQSAMDDDSRLIVIDPVRTETAQAAHSHVQVDPGGDLPLARAVLARVIGTDALDRGFLHRATTGFDDLVSQLPPADAAAREAGISPRTVEYLADACRDQTLVYWGMGINQSTQGTAASRALIDLCLATGNMRPGSGPFSLTGQANSMGTRVCSSKGTWPGHRTFTDSDHRQTVANTWGVPVERLPADPGPGPVEIVESIADGSVEAVYTVATNPAAGLPDASEAREHLDEAFLVAQDVFRTETTELADVVLPATTWGETDGTTMNMERTVSRVRAGTDTPATVWDDIDIIAAIAHRIAPDLLPDPPVDPSAIFEEFAALTAGTPADCSGISYDRLDDEGAVRWPAPDDSTAGGYRYYDGDDEAWTFETESGKANFSTPGVGETGLPELTDEEYPLVLTTGRTAEEYNTGVRTRAIDDPEMVTARVHPKTAREQLDTETDEPAAIESRRGSVTAAIQTDTTVPKGLVWLPIHHPATNELTVSATDPQSNEPNYKQCAVRLLAGQPDVSATEERSETADDEANA